MQVTTFKEATIALLQSSINTWLSGLSADSMVIEYQYLPYDATEGYVAIIRHT